MSGRGAFRAVVLAFPEMPPCIPLCLRQILTLLAFAGSCAIAAGSELAPSVAVLDFTGRGVSEATAKAVADRLSESLRDSGTYRVMSRSRVSAWRDLSRGGRFLARCDQFECAQRAGRVMQVDRVLVGSVEAQGPKLVLTVRLLEVASGKPLGRVVFETDSGETDLLDRGTKVVSIALSQRMASFEPVRSWNESLSDMDRSDRLRIHELKEKRQGWARAAGITGLGGGGLICLGVVLSVREAVGCAIGNAMGAAYEGETDESCRESTGPKVLMGAGLVLGAVAVASAVMTVKYDLELRSLVRRKSVEISLAPLADPISAALGLATNLEF